MSGKMGTALVVMSIVGAVLSSPAHAACWEGQAVKAAKIRDLQTMMMVGALRCRGTRDNLLPAYNRFVNNNRAALSAGNDALRGHFLQMGSGQAGYDRFTTSLANSYGAGQKGISDCDQLRDIAEDAANAKGRTDKLLEIADELGVNPVGSGKQCRVNVATR